MRKFLSVKQVEGDFLVVVVVCRLDAKLTRSGVCFNYSTKIHRKRLKHGSNFSQDSITKHTYKATPHSLGICFFFQKQPRKKSVLATCQGVAKVEEARSDSVKGESGGEDAV